ncbi:helix-turn-helix transcriptional regulator [Aminobacter sp. HY435]|uniref:helix-turn-helix transcriptional regulator n=1 Tax=Aminobacter sp. HY435 TaxID=2970917 RepID=UPI0022B99197|nr:AraC family transcriptional regulator [Aminobacter sp. HY435]
MSGANVLDFVPPSQDVRASTARGGAIHSIKDPGEASLVAEAHYATVFLTSVPGVRSSLNGGPMQNFDIPLGGIGLVPATGAGVTAWSTRRESVAIVITPASLQELAGHEFDTEMFELQPVQAKVPGPWALQLAGLLKTELTTRAPVNELYLDSLITVFGVHLLRNFTDIAGQKCRRTGGLSPQNERRARDYLAANFAGKITVAELAAECQLSPSHFIQAFGKSFGQRPHEYLTNLRLDHAASILALGWSSIADVAHLSGFSSQSHLTATLRKHRGITPAQLRPAK